MSALLLRPYIEQNKYDIDCFRPADAYVLPDLFRRTYGEHYLVGEVYDPAHYWRANADGSAISLVARGRDGLPAGHLGLLASPPYRGVREVGQGVINPAYRGQGVLNALIDRAVTMAEAEPGCCGLFGASLTNHTLSQRSVWRAEFVDVGFEIGFVPARMMEIEAKATGPVATCVQYRAFEDVPQQQTFLPAAYRDLLLHLFDHLGLRRVFDAPDGSLDQTGRARVETQDLPRFDLMRLTVHRSGHDLAAIIAEAERQARANGREMMQVTLELGSPASDAACQTLRNAGFWFGALLPRWFDDDALLLQKSLGQPNFEGIEAFTNDAKALLRFIRTDAERQMALAERGI